MLPCLPCCHSHRLKFDDLQNLNDNDAVKKGPADGDNNEDSQSKGEHASVVAAHYNHIEDKGLKERFNSPIFYLRNFNNWVKSVLIQEYIDKVKEKDYGKALKVLDICCGKGGDLSKWQKARVDHVIFADIAEVSIQQCQARYEDLKRRQGRLFSAEFIALDCTKAGLRHKYRDPSINFDLVSCQFGLHYSFESLGQARRMLTNISECLRPGGYFFGTIPNAYEIVSRAQKSENNAFENRIYKIKLLFDPRNGYPLFGAKYDFQLEGVVNCPEFLVNFKLFVKLAAEYGLELVYQAGFSDFYNDYSVNYKQLIERIMCFETYPPPHGKELIGDEVEYEHAKVFWDSNNYKTENTRLGTMSTCEWEVATIYMAFAFKKCKTSWDANGKPQYSSASKNESGGEKSSQK
ncbi:PREDICTED: mRNA cap guanine-N7 methyltransferase isoform X2 [Papilio polytes]|uniref:mRNA cap guanine-N7 methyltransferase isoform X2 n=1 Tax=Papilio polytes TaxID=76194 RepID=UPI0006762A8E|nr:PREDICTED: mRNA cap guanine-N7 methyltransferase isoform X2 [Papilio polytes]